MSQIKVLVPVSGGKDSQAVLKLSLQHFQPENIRGLFCDTQFEHPETYRHIDRMSALYGVRIDTVTGGSVLEKSVKYGRFPGGGARHCTDELKIRETRLYCAELSEKQGGFEVWYGMRTGESSARARKYSNNLPDELFPMHELMPSKYPKFLFKRGVMCRLPILDWTTEQVFEFLDGEENPLYTQGFDRVGCFPCLASGDKWKEKAFQHDDFGREQYQKVIQISKEIGKSIWTSKGGKERNEGPGCLVCSI